MIELTDLGGDQRDRDRAKAQKKLANSNKGKSNSAKDKEAYIPINPYHLDLHKLMLWYRHAEAMREKQKQADERKAAEAANAKKK